MAVLAPDTTACVMPGCEIDSRDSFFRNAALTIFFRSHHGSAWFDRYNSNPVVHPVGLIPVQATKASTT